MTAAGTAPSSSRQWWSRKPSSSPASLLTDSTTLYVGTIPPRPGPLMTPATTTTKMSSNAFSTTHPKSSSSRFNFAAVLPSFATRSKKQPPLEIQSPPSKAHSLPAFPLSSSSPTSSVRNARFSRGATSGTSRESNEGPLTPGDDPATVSRVSYHHSLMTLTDFSDPFASDLPLHDRRSSTHSDKSIGKRLMSKVEHKSKSPSRIPTGDGPRRRESNRDRSATLPSRARAPTDSSNSHFPHHTVTAQQQYFSPPSSPPVPTSPRLADVVDNGTLTPASSILRRSKGTKNNMPSPDISSSPNTHQRTNSSTSNAKDSLTEGNGSYKSFIAPPLNPTLSGHHTYPSYSSVGSALTSPTVTSTQSSPPPGPPPKQELPPTPGSLIPFRTRAETMASTPTSPVSFSSSLSSLSFTSQPSPQDTSTSQSFSNLTVQTRHGDVRRMSSGSSLGSGSASGSAHLVTPHSSGLEGTPKAQKHPLPDSRPLPALPTSPPPPHLRERALSAASSAHQLPQDNHIIANGIKPLRKQRSFHNASLQVHRHIPSLRHYSSFEPPVSRSPPPSGPPPPHDLPPLPLSPTTAPAGKRPQLSKDPVTSPRRKLFSSHKHDRERKHEPDALVASPTSITTPTPSSPPSTLHHSSSWYDEASTAESVTTPTASDVTQHIVPPAELLRLGAAWERENINASNSPLPSGSTVLTSSPWFPTSRLPLPRSTSLLAPKPRTSFESPVPLESYTSLSPPPRRARPVTSATAARSRRTLSNASTASKAGSTASILIGPVAGAGMQRKPSFLDMTARRSVSIELPSDQRDSFLELSRGMDSIDTIRESEMSFQ